MGTFYVDAINGSNDNDGLSPATAFADFYSQEIADESDANISTFWVVGGSDFILVEMRSHINFRNVYSWPSVEDEMYLSRPQDGIDAGWDDTAGRSSIDISTFYFLSNRGNSNVVKMHGFNITSSNDDNTAWKCTGGHFDFVECEINIKRYDRDLWRSYNGFLRESSGGAVKFIARNCTFDMNDGGSIVSWYTEENTAHSDITIENCSGTVGCVMSSYSSNNNVKYYNNNVTIDRCNLKIFNDVVISGKNGASGTTNKGYISIIDSNIEARRVFRQYAPNSYYDLGYNEFNIKRSNLVLANDMIYYVFSRRSSALSSTTDRSLTVIMEDSYIKCLRVVSDSNTKYSAFSFEKLSAINCTFDMTSLMHVERSLSEGEIIFYNNKIDRCSEGFIDIYTVSSSYRQFSKQKKSKIDIIDSEIGGIFIKGIGKAYIFVSGSKIVGDFSSDASLEEVTIVNSTVTGLNGEGRYNVIGSKVIKSTDSLQTVGSPALAVFESCDIEESELLICEKGGEVVVHGGKINVDVANRIDGKMSIYNSVLNGVRMSMFSKSSGSIKALSPVNRSGSNEYSMYIAGSMSEISKTNIDSVRGIVQDGSTSINVFFSSSTPIDLESDRILIHVITESIDGTPRTIGLIVEEDTSSTWNGTTAESVSYVAKSNEDITDVDFSKELKSNINIMFNEGSPVDLFFDLLLKGE